MLNWKIASNPLNWIIIPLMVYIAIIGGVIVSDYFNTKRNA